MVTQLVCQAACEGTLTGLWFTNNSFTRLGWSSPTDQHEFFTYFLIMLKITLCYQLSEQQSLTVLTAYQLGFFALVEPVIILN